MPPFENPDLRQSLTRPACGIPRTHLPALLAVAGGLLCAGCQTDSGDICPVLYCQLRVPKSASPDPKTTRINLDTSTGADSHYLWGYNQKLQKEEGDFLIFEPDDFVLDTDTRRAVTINDFSTPEQMFRLSLPRNPKARDWSQWQRPDFLATGNVDGEFIFGQKIQEIITNVPPDCFELRYKIEMENLGK